MRPRVTGAVIAGGEATRYAGAPKGLERVAGIRIIDRALATLQEATDDLLLIANAPGAAGWLPGVRCEPDVLVDVGSVAGIHAALHHAGCPVIVVAWDMPFVPAGLLRALRECAERTGADAVVPESDSRRGLEPLCAYYSPQCLAAIERAVTRGDRRVIGFFEGLRVERLAARTVARFGDPTHIFMNVNSPEDLAAAEASVAAADHHHHRT